MTGNARRRAARWRYVAGSLACGLLGMTEGLTPTDPIPGSAKKLPFTLPRHLWDSLERLNQSKPLRRALGDRFVDTMLRIADEIDADPASLTSAPRDTPVRRIDVVAADRKPRLVWTDESSARVCP